MKRLLLLLPLSICTFLNSYYKEKTGGIVLCNHYERGLFRDSTVHVKVIKNDGSKEDFGKVRSTECFSWSWDKVINFFKNNLKKMQIKLEGSKDWKDIENFEYEEGHLNCIGVNQEGAAKRFAAIDKPGVLDCETLLHNENF